MRALVSVFLVTSFMAATSLACGAPVDGPLAPGKPAGTRPAQSLSLTTGAEVVLGAGALLGAMLALQSHGAAKIISSTAPVNPSNAAVSEAASLNTNP